jgi:hypothetical protein
MRLKGWNVIDRSFLARGSDPTWVGKYELRKDGWTLTVTEFQLVYSIKNGQKETTGLSEREASNQLRTYGAPTIEEISDRLRRESLKGTGWDMMKGGE